MVNDKDSDSILSLLPHSANYYFTRADIPRALDPDILRKKALGYSLKEILITLLLRHIMQLLVVLTGKILFL